MSSLKRLCNEPLVQFLVIGAILFGLNALLTTNKQDPKNIIIDDARIAELSTIFTEGQGREPSSEELQRMLIKWTQNEIFYREALALKLDEGDDMIRNRMVLKLRNVLFNTAAVDEPSDREIQEYFDLNRNAYDRPARYDIEQFALNTSAQVSASDAKALAAELGNKAVENAEDRRILRYDARPKSNLSSLLGDANASKLLAAAPQHWVPVSLEGQMWLARITNTYPAEPANIEDVRLRVIKDWRKLAGDYHLAQQAQTIAQKYSIKLELSDQTEKILQSEDVLLESPERALGANSQNGTNLRLGANRVSQND